MSSLAGARLTSVHTCYGRYDSRLTALSQEEEEEMGPVQAITKKIDDDGRFQAFIIFVIILAGIVVGAGVSAAPTTPG